MTLILQLLVCLSKFQDDLRELARYGCAKNNEHDKGYDVSEEDEIEVEIYHARVK